MSVKLGDTFSIPRNVPGGSPQGSILGNYLFCATTDNLTGDVDYEQAADISFESMDGTGDEQVEEDTNANETVPGAPGEPARVVTYNDLALDESISFFRVQQRYEFDSDDSNVNTTFTQHQIDQLLGEPAGWTVQNPDIFIYIDDANAVEKVRIPGSVANFSQNKQLTRIHAHQSEKLMNSVAVKAANIQMKVNEKKDAATLRLSQYNVRGRILY